MGAACCKSGAYSQNSPHLSACEVIRGYARQICPINPPQQKPPTHRTRKYGLSDIVGPVVKKDNWVQTDPLPPPRRRKKKGKQRRRSRSVEFLPYLIRRQSSRASKASRTYVGSFEDIPGQEDALDFQMYFMGRLPRNSLDEGRVSISGRKKEFLSGLLGEENNNQVLDKSENKTIYDSKKDEVEEQVEAKKTEEILCAAPNSNEQPSIEGTNSRRSSITESLREFESSLLDMLEEDDVSLTRDSAGGFKGIEDEDDIDVKLMVPIKKNNLTTLTEEKEEEYIITPIEEEKEISAESGTEIIGKKEEKEINDIEIKKINEYEKIIDSSIADKDKTLQDITNENILGKGLTKKDDSSNGYLKNQPPTITVEIVS